MKKTKLLISIFTAMIAISCSNDDRDEAPLGSYDNGILVLNEGGAGEVTYISSDLATVQQDVFSIVNGDSQSLGMFAQSMFFDGNRAFIISNGSNKITVVNRYTFEYIATISMGLNVPRYGVVYDGKAYVTNMADFMTNADDYVAVIDLADFSVGTPIAMSDYAERIAVADDKVFVANGAFGSGDKITVINPETASVITTITVGQAPNSLEEHNGMLYVLCGSFSSESKIIKINPANNTIAGEISFADTMGNASNLDIEGNNAYFSVGSKVYKTLLDTDAVADVPLFDTGSASPYIGYGFGVNDGRIFISEAAADFTSDGNIFIYSTNGTFIDEIPSGLGPNGFYFNE
ncbi:MAG TPA: DUF5074 domain-containing protein [Flavobacterium sp.]|jgi:YVTN family beta-propeller protein